MYAGHIIVIVNFALLSAFLQVFLHLENDMPLETRIFQGNVRTLLKEIGKDQELMFIGNKLICTKTWTEQKCVSVVQSQCPRVDT